MHIFDGYSMGRLIWVTEKAGECGGGWFQSGVRGVGLAVVRRWDWVRARDALETDAITISISRRSFLGLNARYARKVGAISGNVIRSDNGFGSDSEGRWKIRTMPYTATAIWGYARCPRNIDEAAGGRKRLVDKSSACRYC